MYVWMKVTNDKYELPEAVTDTLAQMARLFKTTESAIRKQNTYRRTHGLHPLYVRVDIGEVEE